MRIYKKKGWRFIERAEGGAKEWGGVGGNNQITIKWAVDAEKKSWVNESQTRGKQEILVKDGEFCEDDGEWDWAEVQRRAEVAKHPWEFAIKDKPDGESAKEIVIICNEQEEYAEQPKADIGASKQIRVSLIETEDEQIEGRLMKDIGNPVSWLWYVYKPSKDDA